MFLAWISQAVFPHHDDRWTGYVYQAGEVGLRVSVTVPPIFEPLHAGRLSVDEEVVDGRMPAIVSDGVEESCIGVLVYRDFFFFDCGDEWVPCHGVLIPFRLLSCCRGFLL